MNRILSKLLVLFSAFFLLNFTACAKSKAEPEKPSAEPQTVINPEIERLNRVLISMSDRCKAAIPNGDPEEFLADLNRVLESRYGFSTVDLDPFYLIDKTHKVNADYEPKNLVHLEKNELFDINKNNLEPAS